MKNRFLIINLIILILLINFSIFASATDGWPTDPSKTTIDTTKDNNQLDESTLDSQPLDAINDQTTGVDNTPIFDPSAKIIDDTDESQRIYASYSDTIPNVSIDDGINWVNRKGFEIIRFFQVIVQPLAIIVFIISALFTLFGSIGRGDLAGRGMWGMVISAIVYAVVLYAPVILQSFVGWMSS